MKFVPARKIQLHTKRIFSGSFPGLERFFLNIYLSTFRLTIFTIGNLPTTVLCNVTIILLPGISDAHSNSRTIFISNEIPRHSS
jgi:hypothetical protein